MTTVDRRMEIVSILVVNGHVKGAGAGIWRCKAHDIK